MLLWNPVLNEFRTDLDATNLSSFASVDKATGTFRVLSNESFDVLDQVESPLGEPRERIRKSEAGNHVLGSALRTTIGKKAALIAGVGVLGVALAALLFRQDIAVRYHLYRLRGNPPYFIESLEEPEGSPQFLALQRYVLQDAGRRALAKAFIVETRNTLHDEVQNQDPWDTMPHYEGGVGYVDFERIFTKVECGDKAVFGLAKDPHDGFVAWRQNDWSISGVLSGNEVGARLEKLHNLLSGVSSDSISLPEHPEFRFTAFPAEEIREVSGFPWFYEESENRPPLGYACLVERRRPRHETVSLLLKKLKDPDRTTRYWAVRTLQNIQAESGDVRKALRELLSDTDQQVREVAAEALKKIEDESPTYDQQR